MADIQGKVESVKREIAWKRSVADPEFFADNMWHIKHPARGLIRFEMFEAQRQGLRHWEKNRYSLTLKARQIGWSTLVAMYALWFAGLHPDREVLLISRTEREATDLLRKIRYGYDRLPDWFRVRMGAEPPKNVQRMEFDNGSVILSLPSANDPARGSSAALIVVDEWAFLPNAEDAWASIEPVADVGGRIIGLSTANGSGNFFHKLWLGGVGNFATQFYPWSAREDRDDDWFTAKKKQMLPWQLAQEYPSNADEAFVKSGRNVFDVDDLIFKVKPSPPQRGHFHPEGGPKAFTFRPYTLEDLPFEGEPLRVWEYPVDGAVYCIGADTAEGLEHGDYSSAHVARVEDNGAKIVAHWHGHIAPDLFGEELFRLGLWYNTALLAPEANNHGASTIAQIRRMSYPKLFRARTTATSVRAKQPTARYGFYTSRNTKPQMIDDLAAALRDTTLTIECAETLQELRSYVRDDAGRMGGSPFDDRVMSLGITNYLIPFVHLPEYQEKKDDYWTMDWFSRLGKDAPDDDWRIGAHSGREAGLYGWR